jgi:hypothetical protein
MGVVMDGEVIDGFPPPAAMATAMSVSSLALGK